MSPNNATYTPKQLPAVLLQNAVTTGQARKVGTNPYTGVPSKSCTNTFQLRRLPCVAPTPYRIGVGNVLLLAIVPTLSSVEDFSGSTSAQNSRQGHTVQDNGAIEIPDVGRVRVINMIFEEAEAQLFQSFVQSQIYPSVSLEIAKFNSKQISQAGAATPTPLCLDKALSATSETSTANVEFASICIHHKSTLYQIPVKSCLDDPDLQRNQPTGKRHYFH